ncbi:molybdenum cofactor biosynthesis protein MoaA [Pseudolabrys sp. Root1462]|uniref:molybdopterin molybdotransferase MoeA n=1 Tax=Pseudolabrys sp. Root1462 TaxID=1736466 RepID=UPI0007028777|nr:gephyrin-like molybdotransferase Glp [Pseudolabrys sp. Root1462]KQZ02477.1 molybdenum cofactor biosynthesis protein MoaA [Pseudolabrys sp. Root1462]
MALMPVAEALARVLADTAPLPTEDVSLDDALGRVLATDLSALRTQPPDAVSAMDGYAVRGAEVAQVPVTLTVIGEVAAGHPFDGAVGAGQAARIFTGGVMPAGADTVVIQEHTARDGDKVTVQKPTASGRNVRGAGIDFKQGDTLLAKGRRLSDRDLMLAAAMNYPRLAVHRSPHVAVLGSGDELIMPGGTLKPGEIVYSNGFALSALVRAEGGTVTDLGIARDDLDDIAGKIRRARDAGVDILLTSGGASVGDHDLMQKALKAEGLDLSFWRVALRPGRPMMHGRFARDGLGAMHVLGVPGNPVSSYVCAFLFLTPLIRTLSGRSDVVTMPEFAILGRDLPENDERADYLRATLESGPDGPIATPVPVQDSSLMAPLARAGGLLIREPFAPAAKAGERCRILKFAF